MTPISVGILGATGLVGRKLISLLSNHPWFRITYLAASDRSAEKFFGDWEPDSPVATHQIKGCIRNPPCDWLFSCLDASIAYNLELEYAKAGYTLISNAKSHRTSPNVPIVIPEINGSQLALLSDQPYLGGIATNPNCVVSGLALALQPLHTNWGVESVTLTTLQAISGAGSTHLEGIEGNLFPVIQGEEEKISTETLKVLGAWFPIRATTFRVPVVHGHTLSVSVQLKKVTRCNAIIHAWRNFVGLDLPSAPDKPIQYLDFPDRPQPKLDLSYQKGMGITIGRLRESAPGELQFVVLVDNLIRGAAGNALLTAELLATKVKQASDHKCNRAGSCTECIKG